MLFFWTRQIRMSSGVILTARDLCSVVGVTDYIMMSSLLYNDIRNVVRLTQEQETWKMLPEEVEEGAVLTPDSREPSPPGEATTSEDQPLTLPCHLSESEGPLLQAMMAAGIPVVLEGVLLFPVAPHNVIFCEDIDSPRILMSLPDGTRLDPAIFLPLPTEDPEWEYSPETSDEDVEDVGHLLRWLEGSDTDRTSEEGSL